MKKNNGLLLSVITVMVLGVGLFLPRIASSLQNRQTAALVQQYPVKTIQLDTITPVNVFELLSLMSGEHTFIALETGGVLSSQQAHEFALEALAMIEEAVMDLGLERYTVQRQTPVLVFDAYGEDAAVLWQCKFIDPSGDSSIVLHIDDETGKMVSFQYSSKLAKQPSVMPIDLTAENWADMCVEYYGFQSVETEPYTNIGNAQLYHLVFTADDGRVLVLPFQIRYASGIAISVNAVLAQG